MKSSMSLHSLCVLVFIMILLGLGACGIIYFSLVNIENNRHKLQYQNTSITFVVPEGKVLQFNSSQKFNSGLYTIKLKDITTLTDKE